MFKITKYFLVFIFLPLFAEDSTLKLNFNQSIKSFQKQRIAIVIGLIQYKNSEKLKYAIDDSKNIKSILEKVGYYDEIILLNEEEGKRNQKKSPTYENILDVLKEVNNRKPLSLLFYYSGHGFENNSIATENTIVLADTKKPNAKNVLPIKEIRNYIEMSIGRRS